MGSQEFVKIVVQSGCEVTEYEGHYVARSYRETTVVVTIPKVANLAKELIQKIKDTLGL